ncbi:MAG: hypothetical protein JWR37_2002 [Mycobacterium sp.]|nr:hypothetical protein [Mycobacterium sp.]
MLVSDPGGGLGGGPMSVVDSDTVVVYVLFDGLVLGISALPTVVCGSVVGGGSTGVDAGVLHWSDICTTVKTRAMTAMRPTTPEERIAADVRYHGNGSSELSGSSATGTDATCSQPNGGLCVHRRHRLRPTDDDVVQFGDTLIRRCCAVGRHVEFCPDAGNQTEESRTQTARRADSKRIGFEPLPHRVVNVTVVDQCFTSGLSALSARRIS